MLNKRIFCSVACLAAVTGMAEDLVLYDTLCNTDAHYYEYGIGAYCGGEDVWGISYDLQLADDFPAETDCWITGITGDYLTELGYCPDRLCWSIYPDDDRDCRAEDGAFAHGAEFAVLCDDFDDYLYGLHGRRVSAQLVTPPFVRRGTWYLSIQPASRDWGYAPVGFIGGCEDYNVFLCATNRRDGGDRNECCDGSGAFGNLDWQPMDEGADNPVIPMRIEGIAAGDCVGGEGVTVRCKLRRGGGFNVAVKVRDGQANGTVTALLDPPDPLGISIGLDGAGRGKGKFTRVAAGDHRVFVCDSVLQLTCLQ